MTVPIGRHADGAIEGSRHRSQNTKIRPSEVEHLQSIIVPVGDKDSSQPIDAYAARIVELVRRAAQTSEAGQEISHLIKRLHAMVSAVSNENGVARRIAVAHPRD